MLRLIQFLKGYVCIRVWGYSPERFMNLCSNHDIFLWNIENHGEYYTMCISITGFKLLKSIVKKTGTRVAILNRYGLPFFMPKIRRRKVFLIGLLGSIMFWIWMSGYIWAVDLGGNYSISNDVFMDFLMENHVYVGMKRSQVDIETLEKKIRQEFHVVTWTSAKIKGTRLEIQIKENEVDGARQASQEEENKAAVNEFGSDLIAENDGVIVSMVTRSGIPQVSAEMEVKVGDLLVSGAVPVYNDDNTVRKYRYCDADADIYLQRNIVQKEELPLTYEKKEYTGEEKKVYFFTLFNKDISLGWGKVAYDNYDKLMNKNQVRLLENFYLPIYYGNTRNREYIVSEYTYTKDDVKSLFSEKLNRFVQTLEEKGVQIIKKDVTIKKSGKWAMDMQFTIQEKAGKSVPIVPAVDLPGEEDANLQEEVDISTDTTD